MNNVNNKKPNVFIYELPYTERNQFCNIMDMNGKWRELGKNYQFRKIVMFPLITLHFTNFVIELAFCFFCFTHSIMTEHCDLIFVTIINVTADTFIEELIIK